MMTRLGNGIWTALKSTPLFWTVLAFGLFWYYAQFIVTVAWNAIELIIAQHLLLKGVYATSVDYQNAMTWRPLVPTLIVTACRIFSSDPMKIYQFICGLAMAATTTSLFIAARRLWGILAAHTAALLALTCQALTAYTINHVHSYSHLGMLIVFGPTFCASMYLLTASAGNQPRHRSYAVLGLMWALCYLCRAELLLFFVLSLAALAVLHWKRGFSFAPLATAVAAFALIFLPYNLYADHVANRDGIVIRKTIYGFYLSQGWADPPPNVGADIEKDGYLYAEKLYGDPLENGESVPRAIARNPSAFLRRVKLNTFHFYEHYWDINFVAPALTILAIAGVFWFVAKLEQMPLVEQLPYWLLLSFYAVSHFILIFHIDPRYLTINLPSLLLFATYAVHRALRLRSIPWRAVATVGAAWVLVILVHYQCLVIERHRPRNTTSIPAMRELGHHFRMVAADFPLRSDNREPHIRFVFPTESKLHVEDQFLLAYFSKTAWVNGGAEGIFPRGKFYSFRECPIDYIYAPAENSAEPDATEGMTKISECEVPGLGKYELYRAR